MASMKSQLGFVTVLLITITVFSGRVVSQSDCTNTIISMASCLNYIQGTAATPPASCCSALANVVQTNPRCLCQVLDGGGSQFGITVNVTQALALPAACTVQTPPVSRCHDGVAPAPGPDGLSPTGSKATRPGETSSASVTKKMNLQVGFVVLLVSSSVAKFSFT